MTRRFSTDSYRNALPCLARTEQSATNEICKQDFHCLQLGIATLQFATLRFRVGLFSPCKLHRWVCICVFVQWIVKPWYFNCQNMHRMIKLRDFCMARTPIWILSNFYAAYPVWKQVASATNADFFACGLGAFEKYHCRTFVGQHVRSNNIATSAVIEPEPQERRQYVMWVMWRNSISNVYTCYKRQNNRL